MAKLFYKTSSFKIPGSPGKFTNRVSVFYIMAKLFYKTSEAVYHNNNNINLKLFSFEFVSQNQEFALFTKPVIAKMGGEISLWKRACPVP
jgi:hypothetical protein